MLEQNPKRTLGLGFLVVAVVHIVVALVAAIHREPDAPVTWRELMIVLIIQAVLLAALGIRILWFNYAYFS